jgi:hypothetical protein
MTQLKEHPEYFITKTGDVYSMINNAGNARSKPYKLKQTLGRDGYHWVGLKGVNRKMKKIHRLVAETFIHNPENKPVVNHIDGNKTNNNVENLEWVTYSENTLHAISTGLVTFKKGEESHASKLTNVQTVELIKMVLNGSTNEEIATKFDLHPRYVSLIRHKKRQKHIWDKYYNTVATVKSSKIINSKDPKVLQEIVRQAFETEKSNAQIGRDFNIDASVVSRIRNNNKPTEYYIPYMKKYL